MICDIYKPPYNFNIYIPIWFYSNYFPSERKQCEIIIYIPIWFYSNRKGVKLSNSITGIYIPIWFYSNCQTGTKKRQSLLFTFQYGSIQIGILEALTNNKKWFTFQYGSIQINAKQYLQCCKAFTFQYGSIQISYSPLANSVLLIYIPIWFYSNKKFKRMLTIQTTIYIPIWFYSNSISYLWPIHNIQIYIPIWFYSNESQMRGF